MQLLIFQSLLTQLGSDLNELAEMLSGLRLRYADILSRIVTHLVAILPHNWLYNLFIILNFLLQLRILGLQADIVTLELVSQLLLSINFFKHMFIVIRLRLLLFVNMCLWLIGIFLVSFGRHTPWLHLSFVFSCKFLGEIFDHLAIRILICLCLKGVADFQINRGCKLSWVQVPSRFRSLPPLVNLSLHKRVKRLTIECLTLITAWFDSAPTRLHLPQIRHRFPVTSMSHRFGFRVSSDRLLFINLFQLSLAVERRELVTTSLMNEILLLQASVIFVVISLSTLGLRMAKLTTCIHLLVLRWKLFARLDLFAASLSLARAFDIFFSLTLFGGETPVENILLVNFCKVFFLWETLICVIIFHDVVNGADWVWTREQVIVHSLIVG